MVINKENVKHIRTGVKIDYAKIIVYKGDSKHIKIARFNIPRINFGNSQEKIVKNSVDKQYELLVSLYEKLRDNGLYHPETQFIFLKGNPYAIKAKNDSPVLYAEMPTLEKLTDNNGFNFNGFEEKVKNLFGLSDVHHDLRRYYNYCRTKEGKIYYIDLEVFPPLNEIRNSR